MSETNRSKHDPFASASDAELLDAWNRDRLADAFSALVRRHSVMVLSVCQRKCRCHSDAEDAYQTTFLLLAKNGSKIRQPECLAGWLHRVAQRSSVATLQRNDRGIEVNENLLASEEMVVSEDPLDEIAARHESMILDEELAAMPERYRAVLLMQVYQGHPIEKMAERFDTTVGTIRGRLQRGKKLLASRLRRRGVVPLVAFTASVATQATNAEAGSMAGQLIQTLGTTTVPPSPPIPESLVKPLLSTGNKFMSPMNLGLGCGAAMIGTLGLLLVQPPANVVGAGGDNGTNVITAQLGPANIQKGGSGNANPAVKIQASANADTSKAAEQPPQEERSEVAKQLLQAMDRPEDLSIETSLEGLADELQRQLQLPVLLDQRAIQFAELSVDQPVKYISSQEPLRSSLRKILEPLGLKATIDNEGIVVTADHTQLVYRGIGTDRWLNADDEKMRELSDKLSMGLNETFVETPLKEAVVQLSKSLDINFIVDRRALDEIGLDSSTSVNIDLDKEVVAYDFIQTALRNLDLTLMVLNNVPTVTTIIAADDNLLTRIYWLEGLALDGNYDSIMQTIQTSIEPDAWEALGGNCTMGPGPGERPSLIISARYDIHRQIEDLIDALRSSTFNSSAKDIVRPMPVRRASGFGGMGGDMGGFGGGGGLGGGGFMN
ncbi:sigma-70 family RNA polymerase sigma factor [Stieleria sp. JC731]|nr:sigma-70 family RNA polymerase sigma factor [Stieleria sp. JC731]MCC9599113.1 sigma-70 family RNA polymerase sigma factor [Stieleria sp. JC731]